MYLMREDNKVIVNLQNCRAIRIDQSKDYFDGGLIYPLHIDFEDHSIWMKNYKSMQEAQEALAEIMKKLEVHLLWMIATSINLIPITTTLRMMP